MNTRPDLAFAIGYVSHFLEETQENHLVAVKRILRYVAHTSNWGLWFGWKKGNHALLIGFRDADFTGDVDTRKSTTGVIFFLVNNSVTWQSMKQRVVTQSRCELEYIAVANVVSGTMACSYASRDAEIYAECAIAEGGQQVRHCINQESSTRWTD
jgi:hypothetical protein